MAPPFNFRLQRVRDIRAHDEDQAKERFAASLSQRARGEALLRAAEDRLRGISTPATGRAVSGVDLVSHQAWVDRLKRTRDAAAVGLRGLDSALQASRAQLTDASRARQVLDQLEERQRAAHRLETARLDGAELDEMGLRVFARGQAAA